MRSTLKRMLKEEIRKPGWVSEIVSGVYTLLGRNRFSVHSGNTFSKKGAFLHKSRIIVRGKNNSIQLEQGVNLRRFKLYVNGDGNQIRIGRNCSASGLEIVVDDRNNRVDIGEHTVISGKTHLACIEGTEIRIGQNCLLSANITFRTGDSHSVLDMNGHRINSSKSIKVADHVWIGNGVAILKGATIAKDSIIGTGSIVTKEFQESNVVLAGNPARIVKRDVNWSTDRI